MATRVSYHLGGFDPSRPAQNRAEQWDSAAGYTRWSKAGAVLEQRTLHSDEAAALAAEDAQQAADNNGSTLRQQAAQALVTNRTYAALTSPTNAQTTAQVKALTRQMNALIRLTLGQFDGTD